MRVCAVVCEHGKSPATCGTRVQLFGFSTSVCQFRVKSFAKSSERDRVGGIKVENFAVCVFV